MASIDRKHVLPASDSKAWPNKKARSSCTGPSTQQAMNNAGATSFPAMATPPAAAACAAWMPPAAGPASTTPSCAPSMPAMGHHMPFFMPPPMMPPPMMAMQACMMMQMQMQAMQSMMQQQQQQQPGADNQQQAKPTPAAAAAASLGYPGPLPCYPPFPFMPMAAPPMCFPPMHAPTAMMQPQATAQPACSSASPAQPLAAAAPAPCQPHQAAPCAPTSGAHAPQQRHACASPVPQAPVVPVSDVAATNLSDKDFAAFIDSFVGDDGPVPDAALISRTLQTSCEVAAASPNCHLQPAQEQDAALTALAAGGSSVRSLSGGSDSAEDDFSIYLDDMLPLDAVASQVESSLASYSASTTGRPSKCSGPSERASTRAAFLGSAAELLLQDEEDGEESDLIFGLGCHLDSLLPGC